MTPLSYKLTAKISTITLSSEPADLLLFYSKFFLCGFGFLAFYSCQYNLYDYGLTFLAASTISPHVAKAI